MTVWTDAQLSPKISSWIDTELGIEVRSVADVGLRDAEDLEIFRAAKAAQVIVITKDRDFVDLLDRFGPPPKIIWLTCGNTSNTRLKEIFTLHLNKAIEILIKDDLVEIG
jgi:predicted nuclease of predicted toxin-antitoxin system